MFPKGNPSNSTASDSRSYILYLGQYLDEAIVHERGLRTRNAAGSNRMLRIAEALHSVGQRVIIVSPAISMRVSWVGRLIHPPRKRRQRGIVVAFSAALGLPILSVMFECLFLLSTIYNIAANHKISALIVYDFSPSFVFISIVAKYLLKIQIISDIEDISVPSWRDWSKRTEVRPLQQLISYVNMNIVIRVANKIIIPTERFNEFIPNNKQKLVITGCMPVPLSSGDESSSRNGESQPLRLLFAGKIEFEHGIACLLAALGRLTERPQLATRLQVDICGTGSKESWLVDNLQQMGGLQIRYHGFLSDEKYQVLLSEADICVALQDPHGRYGKYNVPSKVYEFMGYGKLVIATDVGDLDLLPKEVIVICDPYDVEHLYTILLDIINDTELIRHRGMAAAHYVKRNFAYSIVGINMCNFMFQS